jgi:hypothetical protein
MEVPRKWYCLMSFLVRRGVLQSLGGALNVADVFSIDLWDGTDIPRDITTGLDGVDGDVFTHIKERLFGFSHHLFDSVRGAGEILFSDLTDAETNAANALTAFNSDGYSLGNSSRVNGAPRKYVGWSFKKAPKFFDVIKVSKTLAVQSFTHELGADVGLFHTKRLDLAADWYSWHRTLTADEYLLLNESDAKSAPSVNRWDSTIPTSSTVTLGSDFPNGDYVIYLYSHDPSPEGIIQCGEFDATGGNVFVDLGWAEGVQYVEVKRYDGVGDWEVFDTTRGMTEELNPNLSNVETTVARVTATTTGFTFVPNEAANYIYKAIRAPS